MADAKVNKEALVKRLKRIEGQVRGIQKMVEEGRDCESVITQLAAVRSAVEGVGAILLNDEMKTCFRKEDGSTDVNALARAVAIWGRVRVGDNSQ